MKTKVKSLNAFRIEDKKSEFRFFSA